MELTKATTTAISTYPCGHATMRIPSLLMANASALLGNARQEPAAKPQVSRCLVFPQERRGDHVRGETQNDEWQDMDPGLRSDNNGNHNQRTSTDLQDVPENQDIVDCSVYAPVHKIHERHAHEGGDRRGDGKPIGAKMQHEAKQVIKGDVHPQTGDTDEHGGHGIAPGVEEPDFDVLNRTEQQHTHVPLQHARHRSRIGLAERTALVDDADDGLCQQQTGHRAQIPAALKETNPRPSRTPPDVAYFHALSTSLQHHFPTYLLPSI